MMKMLMSSNWYCLSLHVILAMIVVPLDGYPTIKQQQIVQQQNIVQQLDKIYFKPPQLEETIEEVQKILADDPNLPRLTRGEIEELYEKVTREEYERSLRAGDMGRADSMRALMLVMPYNTDNSTQENLQELYTRPPVTKVIDAYTLPHPIKFVTPDPNFVPKTDDALIGKMAATTYKPPYSVQIPFSPINPTTYHPHLQAPSIVQQMTPLSHETYSDFQPITRQVTSYGYDLQNGKPLQQRFSSHYNAKHADFLKPPVVRKPLMQQQQTTTTTTTIRPVADVLESLGIVGQMQSRNRFGIEDYVTAESAPQAVVSSYTPHSLYPSSSVELQHLRQTSSFSPMIKADAYSSFKPLNIGEQVRFKPEMEGYLTRFGIVNGRKRKALKKKTTTTTTTITGAAQPLEQDIEESELTIAKVPGVKATKANAALGHNELEKLIVNLQELERLNINPKGLTASSTAPTIYTTARPMTTKRPTTTTTRRTTTTSTTTTTTAIAAPHTTTPTPSLQSSGSLLAEPSSPSRRIDPHFDLNFGASNNLHTQSARSDELSKLLENLQELEKLKINPENVLKSSSSETRKKSSASALPTSATISPDFPIRSQTIVNRFVEFPVESTQGVAVESESQQLQRLLRELQLSQQPKKTTASPRIPTNSFGDLSQLRRLLTDDRELERLYNEMRQKQGKGTTKKPTTTTSSTSPPTTTTTAMPGPRYTAPGLSELQEIQRYFAEFEQARASESSTTARPTVATTKRSTTTTSTTPTPPPSSLPSFVDKIRKPTGENIQLQELVERVQQLERLSSKSATESSLSSVGGFTSRNVKEPSTVAADKGLPDNDFAQLQKLYQQLHRTEQSGFGAVEISTAASASKKLQLDITRRQQDFAQRIIDITNDTGSGSSLQEVDPNDFVQLQKLLSKVKELERVNIKYPQSLLYQDPTIGTPNLVTASSAYTPHLQSPNGTAIVYPEKSRKYNNIEDVIRSPESVEDLKLKLPIYDITKADEPLHDSAHPVVPNTSQEYEKYQQFFSDLEDAERNAYQNMQPPIIHKTSTREPPRFVPTRKPQDLEKNKSTSDRRQEDLEELQRLLSNAQELEKLGITLPRQLSEQIETKLMKNAATSGRFKQLPIQPIIKSTTLESAEFLDPPEVESYLTKYGILPKETAGTGSKIDRLEFPNPTTTPTLPLASTEEVYDPTERTVVFSLTTPKSLTPRIPSPTILSGLELPTFSASKIIEAAIKRAANRIGVSTEHPHGFRRRNDPQDMRNSEDPEEDLMGEFSETNYHVVLPDITELNAQADLGSGLNSDNLLELQRLIGNLQELQKLNVSLSPKVLKQADTQYLNSLKSQQNSNTDTTKKDRRQSDVTAQSTTTVSSTTGAPTRINLDLALGDDDTLGAETSNANDTSSTTTEEQTTSTTEESRNGSLDDLRDSFGPDPIVESSEPPPPKKKNGFYFLADWNSFLEVGAGDDQVVVRLSPKIGDPRLFIEAKTPQPLS